MSDTFEVIKGLVVAGEVRVSEHGYDELAHDDIRFRDVLASVIEGIVVEDYPDFPKGPAVLVLQSDAEGRPIHIVWGIPRGHSWPAVIVTGYRPDSKRWFGDFLERRDAKR